MKKALVGMSGGVDSSVAAYLMKEKGYECIGATMRFIDAFNSDDTRDASCIASRLGMEHYVFDFRDEFRRCVIDSFIASYEAGDTPNPCIECNRHLKFGAFFKEAEKLGCDTVVSGHYAIVEKTSSGAVLKKARDASKDQSYVLYSIGKDVLENIALPLGELTKAEVREIAERNGFANSGKKDSQDICFVPDGDYASVIREYTGKVYPCGRFVDMEGNTLGEHKGIIKYTIGQRRGLGLALPESLYVCEKRMAENEVVLGRNEMLFRKSFKMSRINWIGQGNMPESLRASVKIRYNQKEQPATIHLDGENTAYVEFDEPQRAITTGQAAVMYDGDICLGGGTVEGVL